MGFNFYAQINKVSFRVFDFQNVVSTSSDSFQGIFGEKNEHFYAVPHKLLCYTLSLYFS